MPDTPASRSRSRFPWWIAAVGLIVVAGVIWLLAESLNTVPERVGEVPVEPFPDAELPPGEAAAAGTVRDPLSIAGAEDHAALVGRTVALPNMVVVETSGNGLFLAAPQSSNVPLDRPLLVSLDSAAATAVRPQEVVTIYGTIRAIEGASLPEPRGALARVLEEEQIYIAADRIERLE